MSRSQYKRMESIKEELGAIAQQLTHMQDSIEMIRPPKPRFRLPFFRHYQSEKRLTHKNASDALNHAAAFIGYFDGIAARAAFQKRVRESQPRRGSRTVDDVLTYVHWVLSELQSVIYAYLERESLELYPGGQTKPGPIRTAQVCRSHLSKLDRMVGALVYKAAPNDDIRSRVKRRYDA